MSIVLPASWNSIQTAVLEPLLRCLCSVLDCCNFSWTSCAAGDDNAIGNPEEEFQRCHCGNA